MKAHIVGIKSKQSKQSVLGNTGELMRIIQMKTIKLSTQLSLRINDILTSLMHRPPIYWQFDFFYGLQLLLFPVPGYDHG